MVSDVNLKNDFEDILEIEKSFEKSGWTRQMFLQQTERPGVTFLFVVRSVEGGSVDGYCAALIVMDDLEIHRIAVRESGRRQGAGSALISETLRRMANKGAKNVYLDVRNSNIGAQRFYEKFWFKETGGRRDYYENPREDALVMSRSIKVLKGDSGCDTVKL